MVKMRNKIEVKICWLYTNNQTTKNQLNLGKSFKDNILSKLCIYNEL
jgi:hypothetical protein